jgi:lysophospholipase L1-like esterase
MPSGRVARRLVAVAAVVGGLLTVGSGACALDAPWQRSDARDLAAGDCQTLSIGRRGSGFLEVRLGPAPLPAVGTDQKIGGASIFVSGTADRATLVLYDTSGPYDATVALDGPLQWRRDGQRLCIASGTRPLACGRTHGEATNVQRIAFGEGWDTSVAPCTVSFAPPAARPPARGLVAVALAAAAIVLLLGQVRHAPRLRDLVGTALAAGVVFWTLRAVFDPWWTDPVWPLVTAGAMAAWLPVCLRGRPRRDAARLGAAAIVAVTSALLVPHPVQIVPGARVLDRPAAPALWIDAAYWHYHAPPQQLQSRGTRLADLGDAQRATWLVLGGSVTAGDERDPAPAFTEVAERQLRARGYDVRLINGGVGGWNLGQLDAVLRDYADGLPLRGIVLVSILNNAAFRIAAPAAPRRSATLLGAYTHNLARNYLLFPAINYFVPKPGNLDRFGTLLDALLTREAALGREVVLLDETHDAELRPAWYTQWLAAAQLRYRERAQAVAAAHGLALHSVDDVLTALPPDARFIDGMHLTPAAHAAIGARLADVVEPYLR